MTKPKSRTISAPFDARHVGGVSVPGASIPVVGIDRSSTTIEPDTAPSHTFVAHGNVEIPRRSNTIASTLSRPSLRLKTSISLLRGRSSSNSPDRRVARHEASKSTDGTSQAEMSVHSLRKKTSTSKFWHKAHHESPVVGSPQKDNEVTRAVPPKPLHEDPPVLKTKASYSLMPSIPTTNPYTYQAPPPRPPPPPAPPTTKARPPLPNVIPAEKKPPAVRPKRADSGTAIDFDDVPAEERPLGFREILAVSSFAERMALYKKTREYWAHADHGLDEWVDRTGARSTLRV